VLGRLHSGVCANVDWEICPCAEDLMIALQKQDSRAMRLSEASETDLQSTVQKHRKLLHSPLSISIQDLCGVLTCRRRWLSSFLPAVRLGSGGECTAQPLKNRGSRRLGRQAFKSSTPTGPCRALKRSVHPDNNNNHSYTFPVRRLGVSEDYFRMSTTNTEMSVACLWTESSLSSCMCMVIM
jgi:hypothetical protein